MTSSERLMRYYEKGYKINLLMSRYRKDRAKRISTHIPKMHTIGRALLSLFKEKTRFYTWECIYNLTPEYYTGYRTLRDYVLMGADINEVSANNESLLHYFEEKYPYDPKSSLMLLIAGVNPLIRSLVGCTAFDKIYMTIDSKRLIQNALSERQRFFLKYHHQLSTALYLSLCFGFGMVMGKILPKLHT